MFKNISPYNEWWWTEADKFQKRHHKNITQLSSYFPSPLKPLCAEKSEIEIENALEILLDTHGHHSPLLYGKEQFGRSASNNLFFIRTKVKIK